MLLATAASNQVPRNARYFIARLVIHVDRRHTARQQEAQVNAFLVVISVRALHLKTCLTRNAGIYRFSRQ